MSRSARDTARILAPALAGTAVVLGLAVIGADHLVTDAPVAPTRAALAGTVPPAPETGRDGEVLLAQLETANDASPPAEPDADAGAGAAAAEPRFGEAQEATAPTPAAPEAGQAPEGEAAAASADVSAPTPALLGSTGDDSTSETTPVSAREGAFGLGREALPAEVAAWDIDVRPDGLGLPEGSGDVMTGEEIYISNCATCHGDFGEAVGRWPVLMGGGGTLAKADPVKTVGSYWPYLSTVFDYVHRAMPFGNAQSLSDDEAYAVVAYVLYLNDLVDDDFVLSRETFAEVEMPNAGGFFADDRPETELAAFTGEPCMSGCTEGPVEVTARAAVIDVTPGDEARRRALEAEADGPAAQATEVVEAAAGDGSDPAADPAEDPETGAADTPAAPNSDAAPDAGPDAAPDPELVAAGEALFRRCASCHKLGEGAANGVGPQLNGVVGRAVGGVEGFRYSGTFEDYHAEGRVWDEANLSAFLENPKGWAPGTKMSFRGLSKPEDREAIIAYLAAQAP